MSHALLAPSSSNRWLKCLGSVSLSVDFPDKSSIYAQEGTAAHELCEKGLKSKVKSIQDLKLPSTINDFEVNDEMIESAEVYIQTIRNDLKRSYKNVKAEIKFELTDYIWGTVDAYCVKGDTAYVYDFKYGKGVVVAAEDNTQLMIYALGAIKDTPEIKKVKLTIVQPRADTESMVRSVTYTAKYLNQFKSEVLRVEEDILSSEPSKLVVGDHCRWCRAKAICPEQKKLAQAVARVEDFKNLPKPKTLSMKEIGEVIVKGDLLTSWIKEVGVYAHSLAMKGEKIYGCKLVQKRRTRKWKDEDTAETYLQTELEDKAYEKKILSPAKAEKALKKLKKELDSSLIHSPETGTKLISVDKKGEEVSVKSVARKFLEADERFN